MLRCSGRLFLTPLSKYLTLLNSRNTTDGVKKVVAHFESSFQPSKSNFCEFCEDKAHCRDTALVLLKCYNELNRMDAVRSVFEIVVRDMDSPGAPILDTALQILVSQKDLSVKEVQHLLQLYETLNVPRTSMTYLYLTEMHIRMNKDPRALWDEMISLGIQPSVALLRTISFLVAPHHRDVSYVVDVLRRLIAEGEVDKKHLLFMFTSFVQNQEAAPEHALWLLFELEQRCVFDKVPLKEIVSKQLLAKFLLKCAKAGDSETTEQILATMERHVMSKTADILALTLWAFANATEIEKAFDTVEEMGRRGFLEHIDPFKKYVIDSLSLPMDKNFLMILADSLCSVQLLDRAYYYLEERKKAARSVSVHSMDVVVLACSKVGDDDRAIETMEAYSSLGVQPRTQSYNALLLGCVGRNKAHQHAIIFESMQRNGVQPNAYTFRLLIRQAVVGDNIEEALMYLEKAQSFHHIRVEVEMILPILERAARAGDYDTVLKMSQFSLNCDIGIDGNVLRNAISKLKQFNIDCHDLEQLLPVHEKMRGKSGVGRRRVKLE